MTTMRPVSFLSCMHCKTDLEKKGVKRSRCAGCHTVFYDNVACQKKDWPMHKTECKEQQRRLIAIAQSNSVEVDTMAKLLAHPEMCGIIAGCYHNAKSGLEQNFGLAVFWLLQWMKGGSVQAMVMLGTTYIKGEVPGKKSEGVKLYMCALKEEACEPETRHFLQYCLGQCYNAGTGVSANRQQAIKWFRRSAEGGNVTAQTQLGLMLISGLGGFEKTDEEAVLWLRKAAEQGVPLAQYQVGMVLIRKSRKFGVRMGTHAAVEKEAVKWFRIAAEKGLAEAECALADRYAEGAGVAKDPPHAIIWYRKSADQGYMWAQYYLALCYNRGMGVAVNQIESVKLLRLAAAQGLPDALKALRDLGLRP